VLTSIFRDFLCTFYSGLSAGCLSVKTGFQSNTDFVIRCVKVDCMNLVTTSECKSLWGEPEGVHRMSAVNIEDECTV